MSDYPIPYQTPEQRELADLPKDYFYLSPFKVQRIVYNLLQTQLLTNSQAVDGFVFDQKYSTNDADSGIFLALAYDWKANPVQKRPCVIIKRNDAGYTSPVINQQIHSFTEGSEKTKLHIVQMELNVVCIAPNIGFSEELAEYCSRPLLQYEEQIRCDFKLRRFRMAQIMTPQLYPESKDHFATILRLETAFDTNALIVGDDLKFKKLTTQIFLNTLRPLTDQ